MKRIQAVKTLFEILPKGTEGGKEFARIVDMLLFVDARSAAKTVTLLDDSAGDYRGLDSYSTTPRTVGTTGYQYKFFKSPFTARHRTQIEQSLAVAAKHAKKTKLDRWVLVTPEDLLQSSTKSAGGDVEWFHKLQLSYQNVFVLEHWGHRSLQTLFLAAPSICLYYYPELVPGGTSRRKDIAQTRKRYDSNQDTAHRKLQFVGMSVYKPEATRGIAMEHIYIPLRVVAEGGEDVHSQGSRLNPLELLGPGSKLVILGDPGSGKSTLLKFMALAGRTKSLQQRFGAKASARLPVFIALRRYADELKSRKNLSLFDYICEVTQGDFSLRDADHAFFEYYLESGQALLLFDGLDELPNAQFRSDVKNRILSLLSSYPGNACVVTSRIVGYDAEVRFDSGQFQHFRIAQLTLSEIERFVTDWYVARADSKKDREDNTKRLVAVISDPDHAPIRELAANPLLLTIIALVHRIDAVLPDERVVLYQKCTETLLNTWHTWKFRDLEDRVSRSRLERRNRARIEAVAHWMHDRSAGQSSRSVAPLVEIQAFLVDHIAKNELRHDHEPEELADAFLQFVRERAGLLVEVGAEQYSFVHMTFQEYLAAAHIATAAEKDGASGIWKSIVSKIDSDRWQEPIRLLLASVRSGETRTYLLEQMSACGNEECSVERALLLLGCLVDSIEEAEQKTDALVAMAFSALVRTRDESSVWRLSGRLRSLAQKNEAVVRKLSDVAATPGRKRGEDYAFALSAVAAGMPADAALGAVYATAEVPSDLEWLLGEDAVDERAVDTHLARMFDAAVSLALFSPDANKLAAMTAYPAYRVSKQCGDEYVTRLALAVLVGTVSMTGPFTDIVPNVLRLYYPDASLRASVLEDERDEVRGRIERMSVLLRRRLKSVRGVLSAVKRRDDSPGELFGGHGAWLESLSQKLFAFNRTSSRKGAALDLRGDAARSLFAPVLNEVVVRSCQFALPSHWLAALNASPIVDRFYRQGDHAGEEVPLMLAHVVSIWEGLRSGVTGSRAQSNAGASPTERLSALMLDVLNGGATVNAEEDLLPVAASVLRSRRSRRAQQRGLRMPAVS